MPNVFNMKYQQRKNFGLVILLLAVIGLAVLSVGGDYLHSQIHHHADESSREECPLYRFLVQSLIALVVILGALRLVPAFNSIVPQQPVFFDPAHNTAFPRAPPLVF